MIFAWCNTNLSWLLKITYFQIEHYIFFIFHLAQYISFIKSLPFHNLILSSNPIMNDAIKEIISSTPVTFKYKWNYKTKQKSAKLLIIVPVRILDSSYFNLPPATSKLHIQSMSRWLFLQSAQQTYMLSCCLFLNFCL
jgi:hypothetical protein